MSLECLYYVAGIASFFVALCGLIGLGFYAIDTRKLRVAAQKQLEAVGKQVEATQRQVDAAQQQVKAAQEQLESTITPCVLVFGNTQSESVDADLSIRNSGTGIALNIRWRFSANAGQRWNEFPALGLGENRKAPFLIKHVINNGGSVECEFESVSGARYWTLSGFSQDTQNLDFRHEFKRL